MKKFFRKIIACFVILSFVIGNSAYSSDAGSDALRSRASARTSISRDITGKFLNDDSRKDAEDAEDGFVFFRWDWNPDILASGKYGNLSRVSDKFTDEETTTFNSKLKKIKKGLLKEGFFHEEDFDIRIKVVYPAYKAATYVRQKDTIILDRRCFENEDFLYFKIEHEFKDRKFPDMHIIGKQFKELPGLRELFTLITVDIAGFMSLRKSHPRRAKRMLKFCRSVGDPVRGLLRCYEKIMRNTALNDPFEFTEDIFRLVENEEKKSYFLNARIAIRKLASRNKDGSIDYKTTANRLRPRLKNIHRKYFEMQKIKDGLEFRPLTDFEKNTPRSLKPFMPYAEYVDYKPDGDSIFLRIRLNNKQGQVEFAYIYIGMKDNWYSAFGKRGKIYGLTHHKWQMNSPDIFKYEDYDAERLRSIYWNQLIKLPITELINELYNKSRQGNLKELFANLSKELDIKGSLGNKKWLSVKNIIGRKKAPDSYYIIRNIIWAHIDRTYPKLFLGKKDLQYKPIADIPAWVIMKDPGMGPRLLSWLNPNKKQMLLSLYNELERVSMRDILEMLEKQKVAAIKQDAVSFHPIEAGDLFGADLSEIYVIQQVKSVIYSAA